MIIKHSLPSIEIPFIKGHMGGNTIALFAEESIPKEKVLEWALLAIQNTHLDCHEAGLLSPSTNTSNLRLRIVGRSSGKFISACGGVTQVLGAAIASGKLALLCGYDPSDISEIVLETDVGPVHLKINQDKDLPRIETEMTGFLRGLKKDGIEIIDLDGTLAVRVGKFLVLRADELVPRFSGEDIRNLSPELRLVLLKLQRIFLARYPKASRDFSLYDLHPEHPGNIGRVVFPHWLSAGHIEPACGTGTVATCAALSLLGEIKRSDPGSVRIVNFESGGGPELGGPDTTTAYMSMKGPEIDSIWFSHNCVQLTVSGMVVLTREF